MKEDWFRNKKNPLALPCLVMIGIFIGFGIAWVLYQDDFGLALPRIAARSTIEPSRLSLAKTEIPPTPGPQVVTGYAPGPLDQSSAGALLEKPAPDFNLKTLDGTLIHLSDLKGKPVLINVWASWCIPCRNEMPRLQAAYEKHKNDGLVILGLNLTVEDSLPDAKAFVQELKLNFPILLDETGAVSKAYGVLGLPTSYFITRSGNIQNMRLGEMAPEEIEQLIQDILPQS